MNTQSTMADLHVMQSHPLHRTCFSQYQTDLISCSWGDQEMGTAVSCMHKIQSGGWCYPCCAVGSAGVTGSGHWKKVERHEWLTIVMHQHVNLKYISEVIMYWIMDWNNLVLGKGCNISLMSVDFSKHTLKNHSCFSICLFQSLTMPILCDMQAYR